MNQTSLDRELENALKSMGQKTDGLGIALQLPPASFIDMEGRFEKYEKNKRLVVSFPVKENQTNPMGMMQGGYIAAAFDNTFGPLSYLTTQKPMVTIDLSCQYIRGVETKQRIRVEAVIVARGFSTLHMTGQMFSEKGKLLATASTNYLIIKIPDNQISRH